ncbi:radical SAM protein [Sedimentibacter sp. zth1]|uniref:SPL family radical SAM protein n=1 Tax=Sedimentibacter sp. zth1 TaxID=2816908 RepID=UPI001A90D4B1|nr:radical SAM protein [Sedimentibacter sp. zth1]QSX06642.1 radical SAM protein [Sedimentibacter sp. zth1]
MTLEFIDAKTILSNYSDDNKWFGCNYNMNIYKGCCHGCIYCDSRSECYRVDNFDKVRAKKNSTEIIKNELKKRKKVGVVGTGSMSDPYNPFEKKYELTKKALELIDYYDFGVAIATKSDLITRDIDILKKIKTHSPVICKLTITTANDNLSKIIEPNVCSSFKRFETIRKLSQEGIFSGILLMPVLPFITDSEKNIKKIVELAHQNGAKFIYAAFGMTLRSNQRDYYYQKLDEKFPNFNLKESYNRQFGDKYSCGSPNAKELWSVFVHECEKYCILYKMSDIVNDYKKGYEDRQISIFN